MKNLNLKTKRLKIRPLTLKDYQAWYQTQTTMLKQQNKWDRKAKTPKQATLKEFKKVLSMQKKNRQLKKVFNYAVFNKKTGELVGSAQLFYIKRSLEQSAMLGALIYNQFWAQGFAKEAGRTFIKEVFKKFKLHRLEGEAEIDNKRSNRLMKSLGLRKEGVKRQSIFLRGKWRSVNCYAATCEDFQIKWTGKVTKKI